MQIDISIVTYNSAKWLDKFFESLLSQNYPLSDINLYITDNSSTDSTADELKRLKECYEINFNSITVKYQKNNGFGNGHNNNIFIGHSEFILITNVDLEFENDTITNVVSYAQSDNVNVASWEVRQKPYEHPKYYNPITLETTWSSSACVLLRREAVETIGGYDNHIFMYGEDVDLSYRLRDAGYVLKYYPLASVWHYTYEYENQVKPLQFFGSTLANILLRLRFGSITDIIKGFLLYFSLLLRPSSFPHQRWGIVKNIFVICIKAPFFLFNRKKSKIKFKFILWDYEMRRDGAFYEYKEAINSQPLVSVIIRTHNNRVDMLKEAVQSVIQQTYKNIELVIVEDGSDFARDFITTVKGNFVGKIVYLPIKKSGRCIAGNVGLENASGEYCIFLDDDDAFFPEHLEILISAVSDNNCMAAYSNAFEVKTEYVSQHPLIYREHECSIIYRTGFSRVLMWYQNYIPIQAILFSKKLYDLYGGFDADLENLEDWNLWTRYSFKHDFVYVEKTTSLYRVPAIQENTIKRQEVLDQYYDIALKKQEHLNMNISVLEFNKLYKELLKKTLIVSISKDNVRERIVKHKYLLGFYNLFRRIYYKVKG